MVVVPRADDVMGEVGVAVVALREGAAAPSLADLRTFAEGRLATWKLPEAVVVVDDLPRTAMDKIDRRAAAELAAREAS